MPHFAHTPATKLFLSRFITDALTDTEYSHRAALEMTENTVNFVIEHDMPMSVKVMILDVLQSVMTFGDKFGSTMLSLYFKVIDMLL